jgi:hypothetical protein
VSLTAAGTAREKFSLVTVNNQRKYIQGDLPALVREIRNYHPGVFFPDGIEFG